MGVKELVARQRAEVRKRIGRGFLSDSRASVAIEFALLIIPFSMLTFAILESCVSFAASQLLANATDNVARELRTGQIKAASLTENQLRDLICDQINLIVSENCPGLKVDLREVSTFKEAADLKIIYTGSGNNRELASSNFTFTPGPSLSRNTLRVFYEWPVITDFLSASLSNLKGHKRLHFATVTWQNEPFDD